MIVPTSGGQHRPLNVVVVGGGPRVASALHSLADVQGVRIAALCNPGSALPVMRLAAELGVPVIGSLADLTDPAGTDVVLDLSQGALSDEVLAGPCPAPHVISGGAAELLWELLASKRRGEEQERLFADLQVAYDKIRGHERRLQAGKLELERANEELETHLAEIFFTHEFFKALTSFTGVSDVTSLIVDGANGILGAEISAVYLYSEADSALHLTACQGRPAEWFLPVVPTQGSVLGKAFREGLIEHTSTSGEPLGSWSTEPREVLSEAAVSLREGEFAFGTLLIASGRERTLTAPERARMAAIGSQASLALQNALLHEELERLSVTDRLTDLYNHGYLHQRLEEEIERCSRFGREMSLVMLDIDDFKQFNDRYGHPQGDTVLRTASAIIRENLREVDVAARYGGEEFVIVLPETDVAGATMVAERVRASMMARPFVPGNQGTAVTQTVSLGVAHYPVHGTSAAQLIDAADQAMYRAKRAGKNRVVVATQSG